jgi:hypothetical protein
MSRYVVTNILLLLRTLELCIYNSVSKSGGQLFRYQQLILIVRKGKSYRGLRVKIPTQTVDRNKALVWKPGLI